MRMRVFVMVLLAAVAAAAQAPPAPAAVRTMRVDYFHTGDAKQELFSFDEAVVEPAAWSGHPARAADPLNYGAYGFDVRDAASKAAALLARLRLDLRRVVHDRRSDHGHADLSRVGALPDAGRAGHGDHPQARPARTWRDVWTDDRRSRRTCS